MFTSRLPGKTGRALLTIARRMPKSRLSRGHPNKNGGTTPPSCGKATTPRSTPRSRRSESTRPCTAASPSDLPEILARQELPDALLKNDLRWYNENIATDFYAEYHRWFPDREVNWKFHEAKELYAKDPSSKEAFKRNPSLSDPAWLKKVHDRLVACARINSAYRPLFYNLGDESGIADLAAYWDFDFSDNSLTEMRAWLKARYGTLGGPQSTMGHAFHCLGSGHANDHE